MEYINIDIINFKYGFKYGFKNAILKYYRILAIFPSCISLNKRNSFSIS